MSAEQAIAAGASAIGVDLTDAQVAMLERLVAQLAHWNSALNLVSRRDLPRLLPRHVLDSLSLRPHLVGRRVLDVGTGAGFPGLPLAIAAPTHEFTLLDRSERKLKFARHVAMALELSNVTIVQCSLDAYRPAAPFETVVVRAVGSPQQLWKSCARLLAPGGVALFQSVHPDALALPRAVRASRHRIDIPDLPAPHWIVALERDCAQTDARR